MFEGITQAAGGAGRWVTGRGATAIATATFTALGFGTRADWWFPLVGVGISVPMTAMFSAVEHGQIEHKVKSRYRTEIGAALGIPPQAVTMEHVRLAATGNDALNLPANRTIEEALTRNDRHRTIAVTANMLSAALTTGLVVAASFAFPVAAGSGAAAGIGIWLAAAATSFGLDVTIKHLGNALFGYDGPSLDERLIEIGKGLKRGRAVSQEQLMNLIVDANPQIEREVEQRYGVAYEALPREIKRDVIAKYEPAFEIKATVEALNHGLLPIGELAFSIEGVRSCAYAPVEQIVERYRQTTAVQATEKPFYHAVPGYERAHRFADKFRQSAPSPKDFVDRLGHEPAGEFSRA